MKIRHRPYPFTKINSNQIIDIDVKYKAVKFLEDYMRENLDDLGYENDFSDSSKEIIGKLGFPGSSAGLESACNAGDPGSIPGLGRPAGEGIGYPIWYSSASLVAQLVKNPPAMWETWVQSLG